MKFRWFDFRDKIKLDQRNYLKDDMNFVTKLNKKETSKINIENNNLNKLLTRRLYFERIKAN